jgi:hypothetical protein
MVDRIGSCEEIKKYAWVIDSLPPVCCCLPPFWVEKSKIMPLTKVA